MMTCTVWNERPSTRLTQLHTWYVQYLHGIEGSSLHQKSNVREPLHVEVGLRDTQVGSCCCACAAAVFGWTNQRQASSHWPGAGARSGIVMVSQRDAVGQIAKLFATRVKLSEIIQKFIARMSRQVARQLLLQHSIACTRIFGASIYT